MSGFSVIGMLTVSSCPAAIRGMVCSTLMSLPSVIATDTVTSVSSDSPWFWTVTSNVSGRDGNPVDAGLGQLGAGGLNA